MRRETPVPTNRRPVSPPIALPPTDVLGFTDDTSNEGLDPAAVCERMGIARRVAPRAINDRILPGLINPIEAKSSSSVGDVNKELDGLLTALRSNSGSNWLQVVSGPAA